MSYGCSTLNTHDRQKQLMDKQLAALVKTSIGLPKWCHNTHLLNAIGINSISTSITTQELSTLKAAMLGTSKARHFYRYFLVKQHTHDMHKHNNLVSRVIDTCHNESVSFLKYMCDNNYANQCKRRIGTTPVNGITDSLRFLLTQPFIDYDMVKLLISPFN